MHLNTLLVGYQQPSWWELTDVHTSH